MKEVKEKDFRNKAIQMVVAYHNSPLNNSNYIICCEDVFIVWECRILQHNKAGLKTSIPDGMYYEYTWNGDQEQEYLDVYKNVLIK